MPLSALAEWSEGSGTPVVSVMRNGAAQREAMRENMVGDGSDWEEPVQSGS